MRRRPLALLTVVWLLASLTTPATTSAFALGGMARATDCQPAQPRAHCCDRSSAGDACPMHGHSAAGTAVRASSKSDTCRLCRCASDPQVLVLAEIATLPPRTLTSSPAFAFTFMAVRSPLEPDSHAPAIPAPPPR